MDFNDKRREVNCYAREEETRNDSTECAQAYGGQTGNAETSGPKTCAQKEMIPLGHAQDEQ